LSQPNPLPLVSESSCGSGAGSVPVFNCIVILRRDSETGRLTARTANLAGICAEGDSERPILMSIARRFRETIQKHLSEQTTIPWIDPPERAVSGEFERFIPIHL
jgi:hypothetical protein